MDSLVSVVVPVYNVEKYLDRCITSIVEQTYDNLEIVLVDDGSTDNSGRICDRWCQMDGRIKAFHKPNGGLSDARNFGTSKASGRFVTFIDSDDYVLPEYVEYLYAGIIENDADVSCCGLKMVYDSGRETYFEENECDDNIRKITGRDACSEMFDNGFFVIAPCKLYKIELARLYQFPVGRYHEDEATTYKYLYNSTYVSVGEKKLYAYYQNNNSITHSDNAERLEDIAWAIKEREKFFKNAGERELEIKSRDCIATNYFWYAYYENYNLNKMQRVYILKRCLLGKMKIKSRSKMFFYALSPMLYKNAIGILGKIISSLKS